MSQTIENVDRRTRLAGNNRFEMLLFYMNGRRYGINVFKVREVIPAPRVTPMPDAHGAVRGIAHVRGQTIPMIDLSLATRGRGLDPSRVSQVIVTEYNRTTQGFLVDGVDRIQNINWKDVMPPPDRVANRAYLTAITEMEGELVQIIDVEKVLVEVTRREQSELQATGKGGAGTEHNHVFVVDDSAVARNQIQRTLQNNGWEVSTAGNGEEALDLLQRWADDPESPLARTAVVISDIEMPRMDGYALTRGIREEARLRGLKVLLHTSLSGMFNQSLVEQVGADGFLAKFDAAELMTQLERLLQPGDEEAA
jgi:two-component system chemotaxis response regulator CheV